MFTLCVLGGKSSLQRKTLPRLREMHLRARLRTHPRRPRRCILRDQAPRSIVHGNHMPGLQQLHCAKDDFVISGDVLFKHSVGRVDLPGIVRLYHWLVQQIEC